MCRHFFTATARDGPDQPLVRRKVKRVKLILGEVSPVLTIDFAHRHKLVVVFIGKPYAVDSALLVVVENLDLVDASGRVKGVTYPLSVLQVGINKLAR